MALGDGDREAGGDNRALPVRFDRSRRPDRGPHRRRRRRSGSDGIGAEALHLKLGHAARLTAASATGNARNDAARRGSRARTRTPSGGRSATRSARRDRRDPTTPGPRVRDEQRDVLEADARTAPRSRLELVEALPGLRGHLHRLRVSGREPAAAAGVDAVDLVQHELARDVGRLDLVEHLSTAPHLSASRSSGETRPRRSGPDPRPASPRASLRTHRPARAAACG